MDLPSIPLKIVISPRQVYSANNELPDDGLCLLPSLQRSNQRVYRSESSANHLTQYAEQRLQLIDKCDRLLAATDQGFAGPFVSSDFDRSAGEIWQQDRSRSEEIRNLSELRKQLIGNVSDDLIFHDGAWIKPACMSEYQMEETCQEFRHMSLTESGKSAQRASALTSYVENEETFWRPFLTQSTEQRFSRSLFYRHQETEQAHTQSIVDHWPLDEVHANGDDEERADNTWSAPQDTLFHPQHFPEEQRRHISSSTNRRCGEAERQQSEKHQPARGRPERQQCDSQQSGQHERQQRHERSRSEQLRYKMRHPFESQQCDMRLCGRQRSHRSRSDMQPEFKYPQATSETPIMENWKLLLQDLEELNSLMIMEEVKAVEQMKEGRGPFENRGTEEFFMPGERERTKQTLRLRPLSEGSRSGRSRNVSAPFQCTVTGPYWKWNSVSPTVSLSNVAVTESIQQSSDRLILLKWMSEHSRNTLLDFVGRLRELHRRLSNEPEMSRLICKPLFEWMSRNGIGETSKSRAQSNELHVVLAGRERARAQMLSASERRGRFADCDIDHRGSKIAQSLSHRLPRVKQHDSR